MRSSIYTMSAIVLTGGLLLGGCGLHADADGDVTSVRDRDVKDGRTFVGFERKCSELGMKARPPSKDDRADVNEPAPRFDAARHCTSLAPNKPITGQDQDYAKDGKPHRR